MRPGFAGFPAGWIVAAALLLVVESCAPMSPPAPSGPTAAAIGAATVLTVRPIMAAAADAGGWRAALLDGASESGAPPAGAALAEFIVRADDGATLSIVQPNDAGLRVGDRVILARPAAASGSPRLVRLL
jgi:hypothetical protein